MNRTNACQKNCCGPCKQPYDIGTMMPEQGSVDCSTGTCNFKPLDKNGVGVGRTYSNQPLHCPSWPSDPSQVSKNCCTPAKNNFDYYTDTKQDSDVAIYRNQGGQSRSTSNTINKDIYRKSGGVYGNYPNENYSYLPGGDPSFYK
jgi:hypothetical protein